MSRRKCQKRETPSLIFDVWSLIVEYGDIGEIVKMLCLCRGIHKLVDSNFSWKKRTEREYPENMISIVRSGLEDDRFKSIYRELRFHHKYTVCNLEFATFYRSKFQMGDTNNDHITYRSAVKDVFHPNESGKKCDIEGVSFSNRIMDDYLKGWFENTSQNSNVANTKRSINFQIITKDFAPHDVTNTDNEYRMRLIAIRYGLLMFRFSDGLTRPADVGLHPNSICYVGLSSFDEETRNDEKKVRRVCDMKSSEYTCRTNNGGLHAYQRWTRFYSLIRQFSDAKETDLKKKFTRKRPFEQRDIFSTSSSSSSSEKKEYSLHFESISLSSSSRDEKKGVETGEIKLSLEKDSEVNFFLYTGTLSYTTELEKLETVCRKSTNYMFGTVLEDYIVFSVYDRDHNETLFHLGGKMGENGEITGFLYEPEKNWKEIHRVFTMRMKK